MKEWILAILRGAVIGLANVIPGVSGGTMMVSMGIYDTLLYCINHLFKQFKKCVMTLLPYAIGLVVAILVGAKVLKGAFESEIFKLPTNTLFIGLILGSLPFILKEMKGLKANKIIAGIVFLAFFALVVGLRLIQKENILENFTLNVWEILKLFLLGAMASAAMVVPGVSGSMLLKTFGYYDVVVTQGVSGLMEGVAAGNWSLVLEKAGVLIPFAVGIVVGIFAIAKLIEMLFKKWKFYTYCGILGMVVASPVVILMDGGLYTNMAWYVIVLSVVFLAAGVWIAVLFGEKPPVDVNAEKH